MMRQVTNVVRETSLSERQAPFFIRQTDRQPASRLSSHPTSFVFVRQAPSLADKLGRMDHHENNLDGDEFFYWG
jgi:hypothetical protein